MVWLLLLAPVQAGILAVDLGLRRREFFFEVLLIIPKVMGGSALVIGVVSALILLFARPLKKVRVMVSTCAGLLVASVGVFVLAVMLCFAQFPSYW